MSHETCMLLSLYLATIALRLWRQRSHVTHGPVNTVAMSEASCGLYAAVVPDMPGVDFYARQAEGVQYTLAIF